MEQSLPFYRQSRGRAPLLVPRPHVHDELCARVWVYSCLFLGLLSHFEILITKMVLASVLWKHRKLTSPEGWMV